MGKITINELSDSLMNQIEGKQNAVDSLLETNNKSIVGAINELLSNVYGRDIIANAIGEPLTPNDSFEIMGNNINGLLSTFKTNMMNNGVMVESGDKFKTLIDKIATIADNEGKGVQYAEVNLGTISVKEYGYGQVTKTYNYSELDVNFIPTIFFIHFPNYFILSNLQPNDSSINQTGQIKSFNDNGFTIYIFNSSSYAIDITDITLYAIGVGKVDSMSGGLNIITATELPAVGIENQLCVISENPINEFMITSDTSLLDSNKTILYTTPNIPTNYTYTSELLTYELGIYKAKSGNIASATYCWKGSSWELICNAYYGILTNGKDTGSGTFSDYSNKLYHDTSKGVYRIGADNAYTQFVSYNELIDFGIYTKVEVDACGYSGITTYLTIGKSSTMYTAQYNNYNESTACNGGFTSQSISSTTLTTMTFDITSISGTGYLTIFKPTGGDAIEIKNIRLYY